MVPTGRIARTATLAFVGACVGIDSGEVQRGAVDTPPPGQWVADYASVNYNWPSDHPLRAEDPAEQIFTVRVVLKPQQYDPAAACRPPVCVEAATHVFGRPTNIIPYADGNDVHDALDRPIPFGDMVVAEYFAPGEIGYAIKHHRPAHRTMSLDQDSDEMKENFKLQDTHIEIVVGIVHEDGHAGVVTLNNPQNYMNGRFGFERQPADYPMVFVRPRFPDYIASSPERVRQFRDNIRTMTVGFNAVSEFPGDYNGGDPLAARDPDKVRAHVAMMVRAATGDTVARAFFRQEANMIYCAELAHVATSAGLIVPLNAASVVPLLVQSGLSQTVAQRTWRKFEQAIDAHNAGVADATAAESPFTRDNDNKLVSRVPVTVAPTDLKPAASYAPTAEQRAADGARLAFQPMTMSDIVEQFLRTHIPREQLGEALAPVQGAVLAKMQDALLEAMTLKDVDPDDAVRLALRAKALELFGRIVGVVSTPHAGVPSTPESDYQAFRRAVAPLLVEARSLTGPRGDTGVGLYVPPSLLHVIAQGAHPGGLVQLDYVGHGLHFALTRPAGTAPLPTATWVARAKSFIETASADGTLSNLYTIDPSELGGDAADDYRCVSANLEGVMVYYVNTVAGGLGVMIDGTYTDDADRFVYNELVYDTHYERVASSRGNEIQGRRWDATPRAPSCSGN